MITDIFKQIGRRAPRGTTMLPDPDAGETIPVDPSSPWPKFRANALQNGRSSVEPNPGDMKPWEFSTSKGIFSSPVIDGEGTVYIGSADHFFYSLDGSGAVKWKFATSDILDASALLDDRGQVIFGAGDGHVYCLDRRTGTERWRFRADSPAEVAERYGIRTYNLDWFEGNISMLADGTVIAPNDNYLVYALDRESGKPVGENLGNEMIWGAPAVNTATGRLFFCTCFFAAVNTFCYDCSSGEKLWTAGGLGTVSASPMLTSRSATGALVVGGFDGIVRAFSQENGSPIWKFGTRDHIYSSPCQLSDGTIVQPSCDGTVYALEPETGRLKWSFETSEPIRSSPAVDALDRIYFGSGEGRLYCIDREGRFRWAYQCIEGDRNDLNGSPALGPHGVVIGGEDGGIFFIPYDYPLSGAAREDPRAIRDHESMLPADGSFFVYSNGFGRLFPDPPALLNANEPVSLVHVVRAEGRTLLSAIDSGSLVVRTPVGTPVQVQLAANRKFVTICPHETWTGPEGGEVRLQVSCRVRTELRRIGLKFFGGRKTHRLEREIVFSCPARDSNPEATRGKTPEPVRFPFLIPGKPGDPASVLEISRFSCPNPTMLPSYNQIGFDSLHYLAGLVEGGPRRSILWAVQGRLDEKTGRTLVDPSRKDFYVLTMHYDEGLVTLSNYEGFTISFFGSWDMPFGTYRIAAEVDPVSGKALRPGALNALIRSGEIKLYGSFLKLTGMSDLRTGRMPVSGAVDVDLWDGSPASGPDIGPAAAGSISLDIGPQSARASLAGCGLKAGEHVYGILLVEADSSAPVCLNYARRTSVFPDEEGFVREIVLEYPRNSVRGRIRGYMMVDMTAVYRTETAVGGRS